jgi:hypothetical protein
LNGNIRTRASNTMAVRSMAQVFSVRPVVSQGGFVHTFPPKTKGRASKSRVEVQCANPTAQLVAPHLNPAHPTLNEVVYPPLSPTKTLRCQLLF